MECVSFFFAKSSSETWECDRMHYWKQEGSNRSRMSGGEEDGVNNEDANPEDLYSKPEDVAFRWVVNSLMPNELKRLRDVGETCDTS